MTPHRRYQLESAALTLVVCAACCWLVGAEVVRVSREALASVREAVMA